MRATTRSPLGGQSSIGRFSALAGLSDVAQVSRPRPARGILDVMASVPGKNRPDMPGRIRQATLVFLGPDEDWRKWCARALAVNRLHPLVCPPRPKEPAKPGAAPAKPKAPPESDPWPYPLIMVEVDKVRQRLLAMEAVAVILHEDDDHTALHALIDLLVNVLGASRVSMAVVCEKHDSPWLKEDLLDRFPVTITVLSRRRDSLTLLRRARRSPDERRRARNRG
jgi:hypothetical protein